MRFELIVPLLAILCAATLFDAFTNRLPNALTFGAALFGLIVQGTLYGASGVGLGALAWLICLVCFLPFYIGGGMAAGDVKLMAAVGTFLGPGVGLAAGLSSLIAGSLIGLLCIAYSYARANGDDRAPAARRALKTRIPYAGAIAAGTSFIVLVPEAMPPVLMQLGAIG